MQEDDKCAALITMYQAQIKVVEIIHHYLHDNETSPWPAVRTNTTIGEIKKKVPTLVSTLGQDPVDEIMDAISALEAALVVLGHWPGAH